MQVFSAGSINVRFEGGVLREKSKNCNESATKAEKLAPKIARGKDGRQIVRATRDVTFQTCVFASIIHNMSREYKCQPVLCKLYEIAKNR